MRTTLRVIIQVIIPLLIGGLIYLLYRGENLLLFGWFDKMGFSNLIEYGRQALFAYRLPSWVIFNLPDALWVYSFASLMLIIWKDKFSKDSVFWLLAAPIIGVFSEIGQLLKFIPGTFDSLDFIFVFISAILPFFQTRIFRKLQRI